MNSIYHCGKNPAVICEAATYGDFEFACEECLSNIKHCKFSENSLCEEKTNLTCGNAVLQDFKHCPECGQALISDRR